MQIIKQLDASDIEGVSDAIVGFVEAQDMTAGRHLVWRYTATVYTRPLRQQSAIASCGHEHRDPDQAERCLRRLLRKATTTMTTTKETTR